jgi:FkbM family methyltransferase
MQRVIIRVLHRLNLLKKLNLSFRRSVHGRGYSIPLIGGNGEQNFIRHEEWMEEVLEKLVKIRKGSFLDVGANVGQTLLKIKSIEPAIRYYGFEPNPTCVFYLNQLIEKNGFSDVTVFPVAIADKPKITQLNFFYESDTDSAASMIENFRPNKDVYKKVFVPCFSVGELKDFVDISSISILKVDVEGAELEVLEGLLPLLQETRPFVVMEILPVYKKDNFERLNRQERIQRLVAKNNYKIFRIQKHNEHLQSFELITDIGIHANDDWCDYVLCPQERQNQLLGR